MRRTIRVVAVILLTLLARPLARADDTAKKAARASYEAGDRLLRENKLVEARESLLERHDSHAVPMLPVASSTPQNSKY